LVFKLEKLSRRVKELENLRYKHRGPIQGLMIHEDLSKEEKYPPADAPAEAKALEVNKMWEGRDRYFWILGEIEIPEVKEDEDFVLLFDFGKSSNGNTSGFEAMFYLNGEPYQAVDGNHKEVFIDKEYSNETVQIALRLWGGLEGGGVAGEIHHLLKYADHALLSHVADDLYYTSLVILETIEVLKENDSTRFKLLEILNEAFKLLDWSYPGSDEFYKSIEKTNKLLQNAIDALEKHSDINITVVGHTHIDVAWLWRLKHTREKSARSFATVFRLMDQYPEYIFLQTQPQVYEYIKEDFPELYSKIKEKVNEGRWEVEGAMWLESDANIPSGESLVRQILFGSRFIKEEFNKDTKYLWLPDVFGYSWALPQILKKSDIDMFMTTKISWNQFNRMPHDTFYWKGIDGSEVLTHFITTPSPGQREEDVPTYTYNGVITPETVQGIYDNYRNKDINQDLIIAYGYGDGGGGVNREMLEKGRLISRLPGLPNIKTGTAGEHFEELKETIKEAKEAGQYVHTWDGELYLEYHRGTYTSQARNKMWNRKLELAYREAEYLWSWILKTNDGDYPQEELNEGWKTILRNQFHDIIPGTSIREVYEDSEIEYSETKDLVDEQMRELSQFIQENENTWTLFNSAAWDRDEVVKIDATELAEGRFEDKEGNPLEAIKVDDTYHVFVKDVRALGSKMILFNQTKEEQVKDSVFKIIDDGIQSPYYDVKWNNEGHLVSIYDRENDREVLSEDGTGNVFQLFEDKPLEWDAWDIDWFYQEKGRNLKVDSIKIKEHNSLFATVEFTYNFGTSSIKQEMILSSNTRRIDFKTMVDWKERQQLLKVKFEIDVRATEATYDIQYGNVKRPTHWNTSWDLARFESVGHQWADVSEKGYGVSLLNDSKYGYDIIDSTMRLSLLKGPIYPDPDADIRKHEFIYSLYPHASDFIEGKTVQEAWSLNAPLTLVDGEADQLPLFDIESETPIMIDAIKKAEDTDGLIVRLHDYTGGRQKVKLTPKFAYEYYQEVNLMERPLMNQADDQEIVFELKPYEVKTFLIQ